MGELVSAALGICGLLLYGQHRPLDLGTGTLRNGQVKGQINLRNRLRLMVSSLDFYLCFPAPTGSVGSLLDLSWCLRLIKFPYLCEVP